MLTPPRRFLLRWLLLSALAAFLLRGPLLPQPVAARSDAAAFSQARARAHLEFIAAAPRPAGSERNAVVVDSIAETARALGLAPRVERASVPWRARDVAESELPLTNVVVEVGRAAEPPVALFVAHHDSRPETPGAGDDGAAVASFLEVLRLLAADPPARRLAFLFTDGEEFGLLGARAFVEQRAAEGEGLPPLVFNFEAIGNDGPSMLFETGRGSGALVALLGRSGARAVGTSLGPTVYERMPNDTDFSVFRDAGCAGLNFAVVGGRGAYHSAYDTPGNFAPRALHHQGTNVLALARAVGALSPGEVQALVGGGERSFFDLLGLAFVHYPSTFELPLALLGLALLALAVRRLDFAALLRSTFVTALVALLAAVVALATGFAVRALVEALGSPGFLTVTDGGATRVWSIASVQIAAAIAVVVLLQRPAQRTPAGGLTWLAVLSLAAAILAPGAAHLATLPLFALAIAVLVPPLRWPALLCAALLLGPALGVFVQLFGTVGAIPLVIAAMGSFYGTLVFSPLAGSLAASGTGSREQRDHGA